MKSSRQLNHHQMVRVAAVTPSVHLGDVTANVREIAAGATAAAKGGAQIIVFPELCLTGYSCADLFTQGTLLRAAEAGLANLAAATAELSALLIVGLPLNIVDRTYNMAAVLQNGLLLGLVPKSVLPNSGEFYERRWFSPAETLSLTSTACAGQWAPVGTDLLFTAANVPQCRFAIEICEDLWSVVPPSSHAALAGATLLLNLSASDELLGKASYRRQLVCQQSGRCIAAYVYAAAGPGESSTDVVYSGHSLIAENGTLMSESDRFQFQTTIIWSDIDVGRLCHDRQQSSSFRDEPAASFTSIPFELSASPQIKQARQLLRPLSAHPFVPADSSKRDEVCAEIFAIQSTGLARRLRAVNAKTLVLGLSGGLDSTLALLAAREALHRSGTSTRLLAVTMPGFGTSPGTLASATTLAKTLKVELRTIDIGDAVRQHFEDIGHSIEARDITFENAQARERTQILMDVANQTGGFVLGTGDLSESALGWCTFNGDHMSMYHVNAGVPKTLVRYLIEWCAHQQQFAAAAKTLITILNTPISPELLPPDQKGRIAQRTEDQVGPYELVDFFLYHFVRHGMSAEKIHFLATLAFEGIHSAAVIDRWLKVFLSRFRTQQFKRSAMPDGPKVGSVALSPRGDWRMPSDYAGPLG
jgi:NAD+ synthase (glutamine-hydrolysing)